MVSCIYCERKYGYSALEVAELIDHELDPDRLSTQPPVKPKENEVYIYKLPDGDPTWIDWRCDAYRWKRDGRKTMQYTAGNIAFERNDFVVIGHNYKHTRGFVRRSYHFKDYVVVIYLGDASLAGDLPHRGCKKANPPTYKRTMPSVISEIKKKARQGPVRLYEASVAQEVPPELEGVANVRNYKQVENTIVRQLQRQDFTQRIDPEATSAVQENRISIVPEKGVFLVEGGNGLVKMNAVTLFPEETCSCLKYEECWHILACKMSIGLDVLREKLGVVVEAERGGEFTTSTPVKRGRKKAKSKKPSEDNNDDTNNSDSIAELEVDLEEQEIVRRLRPSTTVDAVNVVSRYTSIDPTRNLQKQHISKTFKRK